MAGQMFMRVDEVAEELGVPKQSEKIFSGDL